MIYIKKEQSNFYIEKVYKGKNYKKMMKIIEILKEKGYKVIDYDLAFNLNPSVLKYKELFLKLTIDDLLLNDLEKFKKVLSKTDQFFITISFKENYNFSKLPFGFEMIINDLCYMFPFCNYIDLKSNDIDIINKLDKDKSKILNDLENWALELGERVNIK